jgi:hypothetical protein
LIPISLSPTFILGIQAAQNKEFLHLMWMVPGIFCSNSGLAGSHQGYYEWANNQA